MGKSIIILPSAGMECSVCMSTTRLEKAATLEVPAFQVKASADKAPALGVTVALIFSIRVNPVPVLP